MLWKVPTVCDVVGIRDHVVVVTQLVFVPIIKMTGTTEDRIDVGERILNIGESAPFSRRAGIGETWYVGDILMLAT